MYRKVLFILACLLVAAVKSRPLAGMKIYEIESNDAGEYICK